MNLDSVTSKKINQVFIDDTKIKEVILFGSRAKESAKKGSDIDLALVGTDLNFRDICRIGMKLDELDLPYKIDILDYDAITNLKLKEHIDRVGISLVPNAITQKCIQHKMKEEK